MTLRNSGKPIDLTHRPRIVAKSRCF